jgi:hypothetical protein
MWCWAFILIFPSLHPLISIKQLSTTTAERIGVVYRIGVVLEVIGSTTPILHCFAFVAPIGVRYHCKMALILIKFCNSVLILAGHH